MVNTNIQAAIPLLGRGFVARRNGNFQPGEYKALTNVEIHEETLKNRRTIHSVFGDVVGSPVDRVNDPLTFVGCLNDYSIIVSDTQQIATHPGDWVPMWAPSLLPGNVAPEFHKIVGFFRYNNTNYWVTFEYDTGTTSAKINLYHGDVDLTEDNPSSYDAAYFATLTKVTILTVPATDPDLFKFKYINFFLHKDRLWLVTSIGIYFSKATDPTDFTIPNGGFFKVPDQRINCALGIRETIYVFCENSVYALNYSADPNQDATFSKVSEIGGEDATVYQDTPFFINQVGIYQIVNNYVEKILDNEFDLGEDYYSNSIDAFEDYLIINKYLPFNYEKVSDLVTSRSNLFPNPTVNAITNFGTTGTYRSVTHDAAVGKYNNNSAKVQRLFNAAAVVRRNLFKTPTFDGGFNMFTDLGTTADSDLSIQTKPGAPAQKSLRYRFLEPLTVGHIWINQMCCNFITPMGNLGMPVVAGRTYRVMYSRYSTYTQTDHLIGTFIKWYDAAGTYLDQVALAIRNTDNTGGVFVNEEEEVVAPALAAFAAIHFFGEVGFVDETNWQLHLDRFVFEDITSLPGTNGNYFDGDTADFGSLPVTYDWTGTPHNSTSEAKGSMGLTDSEQRSLIDYPTGANYIAVASGKNYTFGLFCNNGDHPLEAVIEQYTAGSVLISSQTIPLDQDNNATWDEFSGSFVTAATCTKIKIKILTQTNTVDEPTTFNFDAWYLELTSTFSGYFDGGMTDTPNLNYAWSGVAHASSSTLTITNTTRKEFKNGKQFIPGLKGNTLGHNLFFLNMNNGALHVVDFTDRRDGSPGYVVDVFVNPFKDVYGNYNCYLLANQVDDIGDEYDGVGFVYYISSYRTNDFHDYAVDDIASTLRKYPPKVDVQIDSYVPDGNEYLMKKFRHLLLMAKLPDTETFVKMRFDKSIDSVPIEVSTPVGDPHYPLRLPINQRSRALGFRLYNENSDIPLGSESNGVLELSDLRTYWSYTSLAPTKRTENA